MQPVDEVGSDTCSTRRGWTPPITVCHGVERKRSSSGSETPHAPVFPSLYIVMRAACVLESARAGCPVRIPHGAPTVTAMLEATSPLSSRGASSHAPPMRS
jgi:hypothetical protein